MIPLLAERMKHLRASEIREILKVTAHPDVISFAGGLPAAERFPVERLADVSRQVLVEDGARALQYSPTEGDLELRQLLSERMRRTRAVEAPPEEILITSGSQQGLDLSGKLLLDQGDVVLCESPTYIGALGAFRVFQPEFVEVATDADGMVLDDLERKLSGPRRPKVVYVIPDFQNPSGGSWSLERRRDFMRLVARFDVPVIEDAPYAELAFDEPTRPALKSLDTDGRVIYLGTFSKVFCPGLRIAWLVASAELVRRYVLIKQGTDLHTSSFAQRQVATYLKRFDLDEDIRAIRALYRERRDVMLAALDRRFPASVRYTRPGGGLFLWVELPPEVSARDVLAAALERKVAFVPGGSFFPGGGHENTLRLNFSAMPPARIEEGVERLAEVLARFLPPQSDAR